jgi:hypothetical protein
MKSDDLATRRPRVSAHSGRDRCRECLRAKAAKSFLSVSRTDGKQLILRVCCHRDNPTFHHRPTVLGAVKDEALTGALVRVLDRAPGVVGRGRLICERKTSERVGRPLTRPTPSKNGAQQVGHGVGGDALGQRIFAIALGYEDLIDHDQLRHDPALAAVPDQPGGRLAGKSTLNRAGARRQDRAGPALQVRSRRRSDRAAVCRGLS